MQNQTQNYIDNLVEDLKLAHKVINSGKLNRFGCKIPVRSNLNLDSFEQLLQGYHDIEIIEWLRFGFSISRDENADPPTLATINPSGANQYPSDIIDYLQKEVQLGVTIGPFIIPPFLGNIGISPLNTRVKCDTSKRRVILDLSFPPGKSVNDAIDKDTYCGQPIKLQYPSIDDMARCVAEPGTTCLLYKCDLSRFFRQILTCPQDWCLLGMHWQNLLYFDKFFLMGLRSAAFCQRVTNAVVYIHKSFDYWIINYLDDFGSAETECKAWQSFWCLCHILSSIGIKEAEEKVCPPSPRMEFLGNVVDAKNMTLEVSKKRMLEIQNELDKWLVTDRATCKQLESIIGKLSFISNCVRAGHVSIARLINLLTGFPKVGKYTVPAETKKYFIW